MARPALALKTAERSPERAALAEAIRAVREAEAHAASLDRAVARAGQMVVEAEETLFVSREALAKAKEKQTSNMISAASEGRQYVDDGAVRTARLAEIEASDGLESAKAALAAVEARLPERGYLDRGPVEFAKEAAMAAAKVVIKSEVDVLAMIEAAKPIQTELMKRRGELVLLFSRDLVPDADRAALADFLQSSVLPSAEKETNASIWPISEHMTAIEPAIEAWGATLAALASDAGTPVST